MSGPSQYKFNEAENPNDAGALSEAISRMRVGQPGLFGGQFYNADHKNQKYEQFNTHTPPDITGKTRIIAVLGIHDHEKANPNQDGWFVSDFFAFWNIFQGITENQSWFHSLDLDKLVAEHQRYLHGDPYRQTKVVLDSGILEKSKSSPHPPQRVAPYNLKIKTKNLITTECRAAEIAKGNILILIFGHGDVRNHGIELGAGHVATLKIQEFQKITKPYKVGITMITTSCFSGGWTCNPQLNLSTTTVAGWRYSGSTGRACGSMFTTALVQKLTKVGATGESLIDNTDDEETRDYTEHQQETFAEFTRTVYEHLLKDADRRGHEHQLTFGAQDDAWQMCWGERTGIPLGRYKERWEKLEDWAKDVTLHPGDPAVTDEQLAEYLHLRSEAKAKGKQGLLLSGTGVSEAKGSILGKRKTSGLYGGTNNGLISMVCNLGAEYLNSYRGFDDTGEDGALHNILRMIQSGEVTDMKIVEEAHGALDYRMTTMSTADKYLQMMEIAAPKGQLCCEYDTYHIRREVGEIKFSTIRRIVLDHEILFKDPLPSQGRPFLKGVDYLVAAFHHANIPEEIVTEKLDTLATTMDQALEQEKDIVKRDPEVTSKKSTLFQSFGIA